MTILKTAKQIFAKIIIHSKTNQLNAMTFHNSYSYLKSAKFFNMMCIKNNW
jgi:hypothetical protein